MCIFVSFSDGNRRNASTVKFSIASNRKSKARKSIDFPEQEGGLLNIKETTNGVPTKRGGVRFEDNHERSLVPSENPWERGCHEQAMNEELETKNQNDFAVVEDDNANVEGLDASTLKISLPSEDKELKTSGDKDALFVDESFDSTL